MRVAIINAKTNIVENVQVYNDSEIVTTPPIGFDSDYIGIANEQANVGWLWNGSTLSEPITSAALATSVLSQNIMAQFTVADYGLIKSAVAGSDAFGLLWVSLQAQSDPMIVTNERFLQGWAALVQVLGQSRMTAIATALNVTVG